MRKSMLRLGCALLAAGVLASCSLLPSATPIPEETPQEQPLYNAASLNDGKLRILYQTNSSTVLCGSKVLYQGHPSDSLSLVSDELTGEVNYYFLAWSDNTIPSRRRSALYDKEGNVVLTFERDYNAFLYGNMLVLSNQGDLFDNNRSADPDSCRVFDLSTGEELPKPENAVNCIVAGDVLVFSCYERPAELGEDEYDEDFFYHTTVLLCEKSGNVLETHEHTRAYSPGSDVPSEWVELDVYPTNDSENYSVNSVLYNTLTGETLSGYLLSFGNGIISRTTETGRYQIMDIASTEQPEMICEFDSAVCYYAPGVAILWAKDHSDYSYEFHDLTTGEVKYLYNVDASDKTMAFYATDGTLRVYDLSTGVLLTDLTVEPVEGMVSAQVSTEGEDYVTLTFGRSNSFDYPLIQYYNADGLIREMDMKAFSEKYDFIASLLFADGQPYFRARYDGPNGLYLTDVLDINGNVIISGLRTCYSYYTSSLNSLPEGVFVAQKGFYYGWMDLNGDWVYSQDIFSTATDEDDMDYYY